jgi:fructokinase
MILVAGEALIDLVGDDPDGGYRAVVGGSPANVAVGTARLGVPTRMLARIGSDRFGRRIRDHLSNNGVDLTWAVTASEPTSLAVATLDAAGRADYAFYLTGTADWQWTAAEIPAIEPAVVAVHAGSLALGMLPGSDVLEALLRDTTVTTSIDLNLRPSILRERESERVRVERQIRLADIVKASDEDLAWLYPGRPIDDVLGSWLTAGIGCAVVTLGGSGSVVSTPLGIIRYPAEAVTVVDTVGAGDAYTAGLLGALHMRGALGDRPAQRLAALDLDAWRDIVAYATRVASITCGRRGADPPTAAELAALGFGGTGPAPADRDSIRIRPASAGEAVQLGELALRSKAHWGYDEAFLEACRADLTFEPGEVLPRRIHVAEQAGRILGFYSLDGTPPDGELGNLWVEPAAIGTGLGRRLWDHVTAQAATLGFTALRIDADPHAEGFYRAMGAVRVGETPSSSIPGRMLPLMTVRLSG